MLNDFSFFICEYENNNKNKKILYTIICAEYNIDIIFNLNKKSKNRFNITDTYIKFFFIFMSQKSTLIDKNKKTNNSIIKNNKLYEKFVLKSNMYINKNTNIDKKRNEYKNLFNKKYFLFFNID